MKMKKIFLLLFLLLPTMGFGQRILSVEGEEQFEFPENMSLSEAKIKAVEQLKIKLLGDNFGTHISQHHASRSNNERDSYMLLNQSEVKGEWVETIGDPVFSTPRYNEDGFLILTVRLKGRIREVLQASIDYQATLLKNRHATEECTHYEAGDNIFLKFRSPEAGYLMVYLYDGQEMVYRMLPSYNERSSSTEVEANKEYLFFEAPGTRLVMSCQGEQELNQVFVLFSTNPLARTFEQEGGTVEVNGTELQTPSMLSYEEFRRWLTKCQRQDNRFGYQSKSIIITPRASNSY